MINIQTSLNSLDNNHLFSNIIYLVIVVALLLSLQIWKMTRNKAQTSSTPQSSFFYSIIQNIQGPLFFVALVYIAYITLETGSQFLNVSTTSWLFQLSMYILKITEFSIYFWLAFSVYHVTNACLLDWLVRTKNNVAVVIISSFSQSIYPAIGLVMIIFFIPLLGLTGLKEEILEKVIKLLLIGLTGWIFLQIANTIQKLIIQHIDIANNNGIKVRAINTQVILLKKIVQAIIIIITIAAGLMTFDSVRNLGAGLLTTAGVLGAIGAFASQQSLSRLFTGLQFAFSQPIKIGDTVIVENENGLIEEITLSYVVVKLWDLRRLILPTDYFFSKGLQNLTRNSTELLGTIFIYADYTLPIEAVREKFFEYVKNSVLWNKNIATFQVTDVKENSLELRGLVSANDATALWNLRCELREKLIQFIVTAYPNALPVKRNVTM